MWNQVKHFATVAILTWLIWWSADRRVTDREEVSLRIAVKSSDQSITASIENPRPAEVLATLTGPRGRLDAFRMMRERNPGFTVEYAWPADDSGVGARTIQTRRLLLDSRGFRQTGLDVAEVRPPDVTVMVDRLETVKMEVRPDFGSVRVESVACSPPTVEVRRMPGALAKGRYSDHILRPQAEQAVRQWLASHPDDEEFSFDLSLGIPEASTLVDFSPSPTVKVSGRFVNLFSTAIKGPVQIVFAVPPDVQRQFILKPTEGSNFRPDVYVRGPTAEVEKLTPQQIFLYVDVLASDAAGSSKTIRRAPKAVLPGGFELERELQEVEFELIERPSPERP